VATKLQDLAPTARRHTSLGQRPKFETIYGKEQGLKARTIMPQSLSLVIIHVIFSTKDRQPFLERDTRKAAHAYLASVARNVGCECYRIGAISDHAHLAVRLSRTITIADVIENLKTSSSKWIKTPLIIVHLENTYAT
jgi:hypothetical protein